MVTKSSIKAAYIAKLQATYAFYTEGSRPLALANEAADLALAGRQKLKGDCWDGALQQHGINPKRVTLAELAALDA